LMKRSFLGGVEDLLGGGGRDRVVGPWKTRGEAKKKVADAYYLGHGVTRRGSWGRKKVMGGETESFGSVYRAGWSTRGP